MNFNANLNKGFEHFLKPLFFFFPANNIYFHTHENYNTMENRLAFPLALLILPSEFTVNFYIEQLNRKKVKQKKLLHVFQIVKWLSTPEYSSPFLIVVCVFSLKRT